MLGRRRKTVEDMSFALDIVGTTAVLFAVFLALSSFRQEWQALLTFLTGYPFNVQTTAHLLDDVWLLVAIVLNQLIGLRLSRLYSLEIRSTWYNIT